MIGIIISSASALAVAGGCVYKKCFSKKAREKKAREHYEKIQNLADDLIFIFSSKYDDFVKFNHDKEKLSQTRLIWIDSSEDDPTSRDMLKDIEIKMMDVESKIKCIQNEINVVVKKIFDNNGVIEELKKRQLITDYVKKLVLWRQNHAAEIKALPKSRC